MAETTKTKTTAVKSSSTKTATTKTATTKTVAKTETKTATKAAAPKTAKPAAAKTVKTETAKVEVKKETVSAPNAEVKVESKPKTTQKPAKKTEGPMVKVTLIKSGKGRLQKQMRTLEALGLGKINSSNIVPDNDATRGMIFVVKHLVSVEKVK